MLKEEGNDFTENTVESTFVTRRHNQSKHNSACTSDIKSFLQYFRCTLIFVNIAPAHRTIKITSHTIRISGALKLNPNAFDNYLYQHLYIFSVPKYFFYTKRTVSASLKILSEKECCHFYCGVYCSLVGFCSHAMLLFCLSFNIATYFIMVWGALAFMLI